MRTILCVSALLYFTGCASGFNRTEMQAELADLGYSPSYQVSVETKSGPTTAEDIRKARALKPQLRFPFKVAVHLSPNHGWRWTAQDRKTISSWTETLKKRGIVSDIFVMSEMMVNNYSSLADIRLIAAKHGADAVLTIKAVGETDQYVNVSSILYASIVGYYFVPGTHIDSLFMMEGAMFDVGNEYLYLSVLADGENNDFGPGAYLDKGDILEGAKLNALNSFGEEFVDRMTALN